MHDVKIAWDSARRKSVFALRALVQVLFFVICLSTVSSAQDQAGEAQTAYAQGLSALKNKNLALAQVEFQKALRLSPRSPEPHNSLGFVLMLKGNLPAA